MFSFKGDLSGSLMIKSSPNLNFIFLPLKTVINILIIITCI